MTALQEATRRQRHRISAKVARRLLRRQVARKVLGHVPQRGLRHIRPRAVRLEVGYAQDQRLQDEPRSEARRLHGGARFECRTDDVIPRRIYEFGVWEPFLSAVTISRLRPGDTFIDVGANVGYYSVLASSIVGPSGRVVAVEPMAEARAQLEHHRAINGGDRSWRVVAAAVAPTAGEITLYRGPEDNLGRTTTVQVDDLTFAGRVPAAPLVELVGLDTVQRAALVKIDVEGDELLVLRGLLADCPDLARHCDILVELTPRYTELRAEPLEEIWRLVQEAGFSVYEIPNAYDVDFYLDALDQRTFTARRLDAPPTGRQTDVLLTARNEPHIEFPVPRFEARRGGEGARRSG